MRAGANPFTDQGQVRGPLYATAGRLASRTSALHRARVSGRHAAGVIADIAIREAGPEPGVIGDIGCGRSTTTLALASAFPRARIAAIDLSSALLTAARDRAAACGQAAAAIRADFHRLPLADQSCDLAVAAFCLYHSPDPAAVIAECARCLASAGMMIIAVKSADSYRELDRLMAASGLDPAAEDRPSLYEAAHSGNIEAIAGTALSVWRVLSETHTFTFPSLADAAEYLATSPKYELPPHLAGSPAALAAALQERVPDKPVTATSVITYLVGGPKTASPG